MKRLVLTHHAESRLRERRLKLAWIEETVHNPDWTEPDRCDGSVERRFRVIDDADGRVLRAVCVETETAIRVVTVTFDRGARRSR